MVPLGAVIAAVPTAAAFELLTRRAGRLAAILMSITAWREAVHGENKVQVIRIKELTFVLHI